MTRLAFVLVFLTLTPGVLTAQATPAGVEALEADDRVRVWASGLADTPIVGRAVAADTARLVLESERGSYTLEWRQVDRLERYAGRERAGPALTGAALGAVGGWLGFRLYADAVNDNDEWNGLNAVVYGVPIGTLVGAVVGAAIGAERWDSVPVAPDVQPAGGGGARIGVRWRFRGPPPRPAAVLTPDGEDPMRQQDGTSEALRVAREAIEALERGDWRLVAELVDPAELEAWYAELVNRPQLAWPGPEVTVEQMKRWDPAMPDAVAEYQVERLRKDREEAGSWVSRELAGVEDPAELAGLTPVEAFARYLQARDPVWQVEKRLETLDPRVASAVRPDEFRSRREAIGAIPEGEATVHVVYRVSLGPERPHDGSDRAGELAVVSLRRTAAGWRLIPRGELFHHGGYTLVIEPSDEPGTSHEP